MMERQMDALFKPLTLEERAFAEQKRHNARMERHLERQVDALERLADHFAPLYAWDEAPKAQPDA